RHGGECSATSRSCRTNRPVHQRPYPVRSRRGKKRLQAAHCPGQNGFVVSLMVGSGVEIINDRTQGWSVPLHPRTFSKAFHGGCVMRRPSFWLLGLWGLMLAAPPALGGPPADDAGALAAKIDQHLAQRWTEAKVEPAPLADDAEYLRRVYL